MYTHQQSVSWCMYKGCENWRIVAVLVWLMKSSLFCLANYQKYSALVWFWKFTILRMDQILVTSFIFANRLTLLPCGTPFIRFRIASRHRSFSQSLRFMHQSPHGYNYQLIITCFLPLSLRLSTFALFAAFCWGCFLTKSDALKPRVPLLFASFLSLHPIPMQANHHSKWLMQYRGYQWVWHTFAEQQTPLFFSSGIRGWLSI